jgi:hypothetical protein
VGFTLLIHLHFNPDWATPTIDKVILLSTGGQEPAQIRLAYGSWLAKKQQ